MKTARISRKVYLDYASTTSVDPKVLIAMMPYFTEKFGNPGAMHGWGQEAQAAVDQARAKIADFFGCDFDEIMFTGSATESNNLAIRGVVMGRSSPAHIVVSSIEHKSVLETCRALEHDGAEVTYVPVTKDGFVRPEDVRNAIKANTVLVSIMYVNNEIGTIQPIAEIAKITRSKNYELPVMGYQLPVFHTDAAQALNYLDCNVKNLGVDMLTFSAHKIYGPKGIGGLYLKKGTPIAPLVTGGNQEKGVRSGTENVPYIVGLGKAVEIAKKLQDKETTRLTALRDYFIEKVLKNIPNAELNGSKENRIANNANFLFRGVLANNLLIALDLAGIGASAGSTCSIKTVTPSEVLVALGRSEEEARQSVRFTLGRGTTKRDADYGVSVLRKIIGKISKKV